MAALPSSIIRNKEKFIPVIVILLFAQIQRYDCYQMNNYCDKELSFILEYVDQLQLQLTDNGIYGTSYNAGDICETKIEAWYTTYPKLMFYFENMDLDCADGHLEFYEDETGYTRVPELPGDVCGYKPVGTFAVDSRYFRIKYVPKRNQYISNVFSMIITAFTDGHCPSYAFECKNSRCIDNDIACNGYDSCGDGSGCDLTTGSIIGIVIGSLAGVAFIVSVVVCCICCSRKSGQRPGIVQSTGQTHTTFTGAGQHGYSQAGYGIGTPYPAYQTPCVTGPTQVQYPVMSTSIATAPSYPSANFSEPPPYAELFGTGEQQENKSGSADQSGEATNKPE